MTASPVSLLVPTLPPTRTVKLAILLLYLCTELRNHWLRARLNKEDFLYPVKA